MGISSLFSLEIWDFYTNGISQRRRIEIVINVKVKFFASLRKYGPIEETISLPDNSTVSAIFEKYRIPSQERKVIILINNQPHHTEASRLKEGDIVAIFPPIGGG
ncbi:MAG: MoaD/ThiS family protein [Candidatus Helarchaeota archaeon]